MSDINTLKQDLDNLKLMLEVQTALASEGKTFESRIAELQDEILELEIEHSTEAILDTAKRETKSFKRIDKKLSRFGNKLKTKLHEATDPNKESTDKN